MNFAALTRVALRALSVNKLRSALTMLGIIIGVAAVIVMIAVGAGAQARVEAQIRARSGLAAKNGITVLNSPGTIDADYRGEVKVILLNTSKEDFTIERGMRIAQLVVAPVVQADVEERELAGMTDRGAGGFGSTGLQ